MKLLLSTAIIVLGLAGCTTAGGNYSSANWIEPVPGSITYHGQPRTKLTKSPVGSSFPHMFTDQWGREVEEIYVIQPDRSLRIAERHYRPAFTFEDD